MFLWNLHGRQAYLADLVLTYMLASAVLLFNLAFSLSLPLWKILIITVLSADIGGGVVSNFTRGTIKYYRDLTRSPHLFVWFHLLPSAALTAVYWDIHARVGLVSLSAMLLSSMILLLHKTDYQRQASVFLFALIVMALYASPGIPTPAGILLLLMAFKLMVGFSAHWKRVNNT